MISSLSTKQGSASPGIETPPLHWILVHATQWTSHRHKCRIKDRHERGEAGHWEDPLLWWVAVEKEQVALPTLSGRESPRMQWRCHSDELPWKPRKSKATSKDSLPVTLLAFSYRDGHVSRKGSVSPKLWSLKQILNQRKMTGFWSKWRPIGLKSCSEEMRMRERWVWSERVCSLSCPLRMEVSKGGTDMTVKKLKTVTSGPKEPGWVICPPMAPRHPHYLSGWDALCVPKPAKETDGSRPDIGPTRPDPVKQAPVIDKVHHHW